MNCQEPIEHETVETQNSDMPFFAAATAAGARGPEPDASHPLPQGLAHSSSRRAPPPPLGLYPVGATGLAVGRLPALGTAQLRDLWLHTDAVLDVGLNSHPQLRSLSAEQLRACPQAAEALDAAGAAAGSSCGSTIDGGAGACAGQGPAGAAASPRQPLPRLLWLPVKGPKQVRVPRDLSWLSVRSSGVGERFPGHLCRSHVIDVSPPCLSRARIGAAKAHVLMQCVSAP